MVAEHEVLDEIERSLLVGDEDLARRVEREVVHRMPFDAWARYMFPEYMGLATPAWHLELDAMVERAKGDREKLGAVVAAPRGSAKSTRLSFLRAIYEVLEGGLPFVVVLQSTASKAEQALRDIRSAFELNERIRSVYGDLVGDRYRPPQRWGASEIVVTWPARFQPPGAKYAAPGRRAMIAARGAGESIRGLKFGAHRPALVIGDDLEDRSKVRSQAYRREMQEWFTADIRPMLAKGGHMVVIGTVLHYSSLLRDLLNDDRNWHTAVYRAIQDDDTSLWPELWSREQLASMQQEMGSRLFAQEYLNDPRRDEMRVIQPGWFRPYYGREVGWTEKQGWTFRGAPMRVFQGVDPAITEVEAQNADYLGMVSVGVTKDGRIVVLDATQDHMDFPHEVKAVIERWLDRAAERVGIESVAYQRALKQQVMAEAHVPVKAIQTHRDKYVRIQAMDVLFEAGMVYVRAAADGEHGHADPTGTLDWPIHDSAWALFDQAITYPDTEHDDILDALEIALQMASQRLRVGNGWQSVEDAEPKAGERFTTAEGRGRRG